MRFPAKKSAGCPKAPRDFPPRKDGILHSRSGCLGTSLPLPQSLYGRTDGRMDGRTLTSQPKFFASIHYQIFLAMELRWRALPAGSAITILVISTLNANLRVATRVYDVEGGAIFSKNSTFVFFDGAAWTPRLRSPSPIMAPGI